MTPPPAPTVTRREALQWVLAASAALATHPTPLLGADGPTAAAPVTAKPYGTDPVLNRTYQSGDLWPLTLSASQRVTVTALVDLILPADDRSPAASTVGVPAFIDEWISAPYPLQQADRETVLRGLTWLEAESQKRFSKAFSELTAAQQGAIADDICHRPNARPEFDAAAEFFAVFRNLTTTGFYTTPVGMKDIGFIGNVPQTRFAGPPKEVLARLGLN
jgi:hypothetical protein